MTGGRAASRPSSEPRVEARGSTTHAKMPQAHGRHDTHSRLIPQHERVRDEPDPSPQDLLEAQDQREDEPDFGCPPDDRQREHARCFLSAEARGNEERFDVDRRPDHEDAQDFAGGDGLADQLEEDRELQRGHRARDDVQGDREPQVGGPLAVVQRDLTVDRAAAAREALGEARSTELLHEAVLGEERHRATTALHPQEAGDADRQQRDAADEATLHRSRDGRAHQDHGDARQREHDVRERPRQSIDRDRGDGDRAGHAARHQRCARDVAADGRGRRHEADRIAGQVRTEQSPAPGLGLAVEAATPGQCVQEVLDARERRDRHDPPSDRARVGPQFRRTDVDHEPGEQRRAEHEERRVEPLQAAKSCHARASSGHRAREPAAIRDHARAARRFLAGFETRREDPGSSRAGRSTFFASVSGTTVEAGVHGCR